MGEAFPSCTFVSLVVETIGRDPFFLGLWKKFVKPRDAVVFSQAQQSKEKINFQTMSQSPGPNCYSEIRYANQG
jgi:hypothetical protein